MYCNQQFVCGFYCLQLCRKQLITTYSSIFICHISIVHANDTNNDKKTSLSHSYRKFLLRPLVLRCRPRNRDRFSSSVSFQTKTIVTACANSVSGGKHEHCLWFAFIAGHIRRCNFHVVQNFFRLTITAYLPFVANARSIDIYAPCACFMCTLTTQRPHGSLCRNCSQ